MRARLPNQPASRCCQPAAASLPLGTETRRGLLPPFRLGSVLGSRQKAAGKQPRTDTDIDTAHSATMAATDVDVFSVSNWPRRSLLLSLSLSPSLPLHPWHLYFSLRPSGGFIRGVGVPSRVFCLARFQATTPPLFSACSPSVSMFVRACTCARACVMGLSRHSGSGSS